VRVYGQAGIRVIRATGDIGDDVPAILRGQFDLAILTYEKFGNLALAFPHVIRLVAVRAGSPFSRQQGSRTCCAASGRRS
jgi:hypothetical protein